MNYIIDPNTNTSYSLFTEHGINLLKKFIRSYQRGAGKAVTTATGEAESSSTIDLKSSSTASESMKSSNGSSPTESELTVQLLSSPEDLSNNEYYNKLNIFGCIGEILKFDEAENKTGRKDDKGVTRDILPASFAQCSYASLYDKFKNKDDLKRKCNDSEKGYGLYIYHPYEHKCLNADTELIGRKAAKKKLIKSIWKNLFESINNMMDGPKIVVMVSHHNLMKEVLLPFEKKSGKRGIANCSCIKIEIGESKDMSIEVIFEGFPDKGKYKYETEGELENINMNGIDSGIERLEYPVTIYLVRHGNAMHNKPMMDFLQKKNMGYRPLDSSLTPLGYYQAEELGNFLKEELNETNQENLPVFYACSNLARTQETALTLRSIIRDNPLDDLDQYRYELKHNSIDRLMRRLKINSEDELIEKLQEIFRKSFEKLKKKGVTIKENTDEFREYLSEFIK